MLLESMQESKLYGMEQDASIPWSLQRLLIRCVLEA